MQAHKAPKQENEKPLMPKRPADARDAREVARKLIKSGAIQAIQRPLTKQDQTSFKRPKGQERKRVVSDTTVSPYQPFSATQTDGFQGGAAESAVGDMETSRVQNLYQQIATERDREERGLVDKKSAAATDTTTSSIINSPSVANREKPRTGNTIYVSGHRVTDEFLRTHFSVFGKIVNVSMEIEKGRGFITFAKAESADKAISQMDSKAAAGIQLSVQLARRQPQIEPINDASSSAVWATLGNFFNAVLNNNLLKSKYLLFYSCKSFTKRKPQRQTRNG